MLLQHAALLGGLREEMTNSVGQAFARRMFTCMGFAFSKRNAELARKIRGKLTIERGLILTAQDD